MKQHWILLPILWLCIGRPQIVNACENSNISLLSYTDNGSSHNYAVQVCIGGGILGAARGATSATRTFGLGLVSVDGNPVTTTNYTPSITSTETMVTLNGTPQGPQGDPFNVDGFLLYLHPTGSSGTAFTCVSSTALCGEPHTDCFDISFTTDVELESITAWGIEGNGNPIAGCTGDPDMTIDLAALPVTFTSLTVHEHQGQVVLNWETASETNNAFFSVERSADGRHFQSIGRVDGNNTTDQSTKYQFVDDQIAAGQYFYRLQQVDFSGAFSYSKIVIASVQKIDRPRISLYPNPTGDQLFLLSSGPSTAAAVKFRIHDAWGRLLEEGMYRWSERQVIPVAHLRPGMYVVCLYDDGKLQAQQRFVKQ